MNTEMDKGRALDKTQERMIKNGALHLVAQLDSGRLADDFAGKYPLLVEAVRNTGKKGTITLTLTLEPDNMGEVCVLNVTGRVRTALPERDPRKTVFYATDDNQLVRDNPLQGEFSEMKG